MTSTLMFVATLNNVELVHLISSQANVTCQLYI